MRVEARSMISSRGWRRAHRRTYTGRSLLPKRNPSCFEEPQMQIQPLYMTLNTLLNGRLFKIPEYQRAYSWGTKQRDDLFLDIRKLRGSDKGHFMATMVGLRRGTIKIA